MDVRLRASRFRSAGLLRAPQRALVDDSGPHLPGTVRHGRPAQLPSLPGGAGVATCGLRPSVVRDHSAAVGTAARPGRNAALPFFGPWRGKHRMGLSDWFRGLGVLRLARHPAPRPSADHCRPSGRRLPGAGRLPDVFRDGPLLLWCDRGRPSARPGAAFGAAGADRPSRGLPGLVPDLWGLGRGIAPLSGEPVGAGLPRPLRAVRARGRDRRAGRIFE